MDKMPSIHSVYRLGSSSAPSLVGARRGTVAIEVESVLRRFAAV